MLHPKTMLIVTLMVVFFLCFTVRAFPCERKRIGNTIYCNGNKIEIELLTDTIRMTDQSGKECMRITSLERLTLLNGEQIFFEQYNPDGSSKTPGVVKYNDKLQAKIIEDIKGELQKLDDGYYYITVGSVVIDKNGSIAYFAEPDFMVNPFKYSGIYIYNDPADKKTAEDMVKSGMYKKTMYVKLDKNLKKSVIQTISTDMDNAPKCKPLYVNGKNMPYRNDISFSFEIKDHHVLNLR